MTLISLYPNENQSGSQPENQPEKQNGLIKLYDEPVSTTPQKKTTVKTATDVPDDFEKFRADLEQKHQQSLLPEFVASEYEKSKSIIPSTQLPTADFFTKLKDIKDDPIQLVPFLAGGEDALKFGKLLLSANRYNNGKETPEDIAMLQEYVAEANRETTFSYKVLDVVSQLPSFAGELYLTGGIATAVRKTTTIAAKKALKKVVTKEGKALLEKRAAKFGLKAGAEVLARTAQAPVAGATRVWSGTQQKQLESTINQIQTGEEKEDIATSLKKAMGEQWVETVSEFSGGLLAPAQKLVGNNLLKVALFSAFKKANPAKDPSVLMKVVERVGWNGVIGEMFEERVGAVGQQTMTALGLGDQTPPIIPSGNQLAVEFIAFSIPGIGVAAANKLLEKEQKIGPGGIKIQDAPPETLVFGQPPPKVTPTTLPVTPETPTAKKGVDEGIIQPISEKTPVIEKLDKNIQFYRSLGGFTYKQEENAGLNALKDIADDQEVVKHTQEKIQQAISSNEIQAEQGGTIKVYRAGNPTTRDRLVSVTTDKAIAEQFQQDAKAEGRDIPLQEFSIKPEDAKVYIGGQEKEILVSSSFTRAKSPEDVLIQELKTRILSGDTKFIDKMRERVQGKPQLKGAFELAIANAEKEIAEAKRKLAPQYTEEEIQAELQKMKRSKEKKRLIEDVRARKDQYDPQEDIIQYHGTQRGKELKKAIQEGTVKATSEGLMGKGFYVTTSTEAAHMFGKQVSTTGRGGDRVGVKTEPEIISIDLSKLNVLKLPFGKGEYYDFLDKHNLTAEKYNEYLKAQGYDGLNLVDRGETIIFDPKKIKSVGQEAKAQKEKVSETILKKPKFVVPEKEIAILEKKLQETYTDLGKGEGKVNEDFLKADIALSDIFTELQISEPGQRMFIESGAGEGGGPKVIGISSSFPSWVKEGLRSKKLFEKVLDGLEIAKLSYPKGRSTKQRTLYNNILDELDERLGVDTSAIRSQIIKLYEQGKERKTTGGVQRGATRGKAGEGKQPFVGVTGGEGATKGVFREDYPVELGALDKVRPIEFIELVSLARELSGKFPEVKKLKSNLGFHQAGRIVLNKNLFEQGNHKDLAKVLAHEIGHLTDFLPDYTMSRGNLLGRLLSLRKYLKNTFGEIEVTNKEIRKELVEVSEWWRPYDKEKSKPAFIKYRNSGKELYADAVSVLFNTPGTLQEMAPNFYREFFANLDTKPVVKENFFQLQELLAEGEGAVLTKRDAQIGNMFKKGEDLFKIKEEERAERGRSTAFMLKYELIDKNAAMIELIEKSKKEGKVINDDENPQYFLESWNYLGGKIQGFLTRKIDPVYKDLKKNDIAWEDFGKVLFLTRVVSERGDLANPLGFTPESAQKQLDFMKEKMGDQWDVIETNIEAFRNAIKDIMQSGYESGLYQPDLYQKMVENPVYATFQVLDYLQENIPASIKHQVGTLKEISNPATATLIKTISTIRAIERNNVIKVSKAFLEENHPTEIKPAKKIFNGKTHTPIDSKEADEELVMYMDEGRIEGVYVDPYIAESFKRNTTGHNNAVIEVLHLMNSKMFRPVFITYNPGFQAFNLIRDFMRGWKNMPGMTLFNLAKLYKQSYKHARARAFNIPDELITEMEESQLLSITYNDIVKGRDREDEMIDKMMLGYGLLQQTPKRNPALKVIMPVLDFVEKVGNLIETLPKVSGYKYMNGKLPPHELGSFIRTRVGSPDFLRRGHGYSWYNEAFLFSNAIKEGIRSDLSSSVDPKTRSGFWWKTAKTSLVPKALMFAATLGVFGAFMKECINESSEYDKTNYTLIPVGKDRGGKCIVVRIPQDETGRFIGGLVWKGLNMPVNGVKPTDFAEIASYTGGQIPSITPSISAISSISQFVTGRNPYDAFRNRFVLTDDEFKAGGKYALIPFLKWQWQQLGGGTLMRFEVHEQTPKEKSLLQIGLNSPVVSNVIGRFIKVTDYGEVERQKEVTGEADQEKSIQRLEQNKIINKHINQFQKAGANSNDIAVFGQQAAKEAFKGQIVTKSEDTRFKKKFRIWAIRGKNDVKVNGLIYATTVDSQLALLKEYRNNMNLDEFKSLFLFAQQEKIISQQTAQKFKTMK